MHSFTSADESDVLNLMHISDREVIIILNIFSFMANISVFSRQ